MTRETNVEKEIKAKEEELQKLANTRVIFDDDIIESNDREIVTSLNAKSNMIDTECNIVSFKQKEISIVDIYGVNGELNRITLNKKPVYIYVPKDKNIRVIKVVDVNNNEFTLFLYGIEAKQLFCEISITDEETENETIHILNIFVKPITDTLAEAIKYGKNNFQPSIIQKEESYCTSIGINTTVKTLLSYAIDKEPIDMMIYHKIDDKEMVSLASHVQDIIDVNINMKRKLLFKDGFVYIINGIRNYLKCYKLSRNKKFEYTILSLDTLNKHPYTLVDFVENIHYNETLISLKDGEFKVTKVDDDYSSKILDLKYLIQKYSFMKVNGVDPQTKDVIMQAKKKVKEIYDNIPKENLNMDVFYIDGEFGYYNRLIEKAQDMIKDIK